MHILVTGGTGFIGSHTAVALIEVGHTVEIVDNLSNSRPGVTARIDELTGFEPILHRVDLRNGDELSTILAGAKFDAVMHFAGLKAVGESVERPLDYYDHNVGGSVSLLGAMREAGIRSIVFSSSCTVYGDPPAVPVTEDMPMGEATNPYGRTKQIIERILMDVAVADDDWAIGILRYFNPVGAHPSGLLGEEPVGRPNNLMPYICGVAAGRLPELSVFGADYPTRDGTGIRDYIHVVDLARGHVAALEYLVDERGVDAWNLGTGRGTSVLELVEAFERVNEVRVPRKITDRRPGDVAETWADPRKAHEQLGWKAELSVDEMCHDAWRWELSRHAMS